MLLGTPVDPVGFHPNELILTSISKFISFGSRRWLAMSSFWLCWVMIRDYS